MKMKALIVDDEPFARADLRHLLASHAEIEVAAEAGTVAEAKRQLAAHRVDVVFLDIQLRGGSGFELVPYITHSTAIIFITAFDGYAVRAFEINALDYLLKPITTDRLYASINRLKTNHPVQHAPAGKAGPFKPDDRVFVKTDAGQVFIRLDEILAITSLGGNYATVKLNNGEALLTRKTLKEWQQALPESTFFRIHRSTIINLEQVEKICNNRDGSCIVALAGLAEAFTVSRRLTAGFKNRIKEPGRERSLSSN